MTRYWFYLCIATILLLLTGCSSAQEPERTAAPSTTGDPLTGIWSGDWGPSPSDRNTVTLELNWDGSNLSGIVNPGPNAVTLKNTSFDPATGAVRMEADAQGRDGMVHYRIDGKLEGNTMTGTWNHESRTGDFRITKS